MSHYVKLSSTHSLSFLFPSENSIWAPLRPLNCFDLDTDFYLLPPEKLSSKLSGGAEYFRLAMEKSSISLSFYFKSQFFWVFPCHLFLSLSMVDAVNKYIIIKFRSPEHYPKNDSSCWMKRYVYVVTIKRGFSIELPVKSRKSFDMKNIYLLFSRTLQVAFNNSTNNSVSVTFSLFSDWYDYPLLSLTKFHHSITITHQFNFN